MGFSLDSIMNSQTLAQAKASRAKDTHKVVYLNIDNILPNPVNDKVQYSMNGIELLSYSIENVGLMEPLLVTPMDKEDRSDNAKYMLISGHRRRLAILSVLERNPDSASSLKYVPCIVRKNIVTSDDSGENDNAEFLNEEEVIDGNVFNREKTPAERAKELEVKKQILLKRKNNGEKIPGKLIDLIADELEISRVQAKKYNAINLHASDSVKDAFNKGELSTEAAYELSKNAKDVQDDIMEKHSEDDAPLTAKTVKIETGKEKPAPKEDFTDVPDVNPSRGDDLPYGKHLTDNEADEVTEDFIATPAEAADYPTDEDEMTDNQDFDIGASSDSPNSNRSDYAFSTESARSGLAALIEKFSNSAESVTFTGDEINSALVTLRLVHDLL